LSTSDLSLDESEYEVVVNDENNKKEVEKIEKQKSTIINKCKC